MLQTLPTYPGPMVSLVVRLLVNCAQTDSDQGSSARRHGRPVRTMLVLCRRQLVVVTAVCTPYVPGASRDGPRTVGAPASIVRPRRRWSARTSSWKLTRHHGKYPICDML